MSMPTFVDTVQLHAYAGRGGNGVASVLREKFKPLGGPDGGNGGRGGSVILEVDPDVTTLLDYYHNPVRKAESGTHGSGSMRHGAQGEDLILAVPEGTVVFSADGALLADLVGAGTQFVVARGGRGGLGNAALASRRRKAPGFALLGEPGEERRVRLELKIVADIGLVGFPNAGKSSLIAALSRARPKIDNYPFTTLRPNLGVVKAGDVVFTIADVPGLIPGASEGRGLGHDFLRHLERCAALAHVVDLVAFEPDRNPIADIEAMEHELTQYGGFEERPRIVVLNKADVPDGVEMAELVEDQLREFGWPVFVVSAVSQAGLKELSYAMAQLVAADRKTREQEAAPRRVIHPASVPEAEPEFSVHSTPDGWRVQGAKPTRWVAQTDFSNDEAVGFLADRLKALGVEDELTALGAQVGDAVIIGPETDAVVFDFYPDVDAGAQYLGNRGGGTRFDEQRPAVARRRAIDAAMATKAPHETRADVARRIDAELSANASEESNDDQP